MDDRAGQELIDALVSWAEEFRRFVLGDVTSRGLPPSVMEPELQVEFSAGRVNGTRVPTERSLAAVDVTGKLIADHIPADRFEAATALSERLHSTFGSGCYFTSHGLSAGFRINDASNTVSDFDATPVLWIERHLVEAYAAAYIRRLDSLARPDPAFARRLAEELLAFLESARLTWHVSVPLGNVVTSDAALQHRGVTLRHLSPRESGALADFAGPDVGVIAPRSLGFPRAEWFAPSHVLELNRSSDKEFDTHPRDDELLQRLLIALELVGVRPRGKHGLAGVRMQPEWLQSAVQGEHIHVATAQHVERGIELDEAQFVTAVDVAHQIRASAALEPRSPNDVAIHRFMLGSARERSVDALIDFVIALEAALVAERTELAFRFRNYGAVFLSNDHDQRREDAASLKSLYEVRSKLVHGGGRFPSAADIKDAAVEARRLAAAVLLKSLVEGWPSREALDDSLLESGS